MKPFDIELAKAGHPVQTRDGKPVRILCYDRKANAPIIALILEEDDIEYPYPFYNNGKRYSDGIRSDDLFMAPAKKEGWVNVYKSKYGNFVAGGVFLNVNEAKNNVIGNYVYATTTKIEWEE